MRSRPTSRLPTRNYNALINASAGSFIINKATPTLSIDQLAG